jgi:queuine tRNA-ribosyltransferase
MLAGTLISIHNIHTLLELMADVRRAIREQRFDTFADDFLRNYESSKD